MNFSLKKTERKFENKNSKYEEKSTEFRFKIFDFVKVLNYIKTIF